MNPETLKDISVIAGVLIDVVNYFAPHIPPGFSTAAGIFLRAVINLTSGGNTK